MQFQIIPKSPFLIDQYVNIQKFDHTLFQSVCGETGNLLYFL